MSIGNNYRGNIREEAEKKTSFSFATVRKTQLHIREECFFPRMEWKENKSLQNIFRLYLVWPVYLHSNLTTCSSYYDWDLWSFDINNLSTIKSKIYGPCSWLQQVYRVYHEKRVSDIWLESQVFHRPFHRCITQLPHCAILCLIKHIFHQFI